MKKFLVLCFLFYGVLPVMADEYDINLTPKNTFSGYSNNSMKTEYPHFKTSSYQYNTVLEQQRKQWMKPTSVKSMNNHEEVNNSVYINKFPDAYDTSDVMRIQQIQSGVQNMYMGL